MIDNPVYGHENNKFYGIFLKKNLSFVINYSIYSDFIIVVTYWNKDIYAQDKDQGHR